MRLLAAWLLAIFATTLCLGSVQALDKNQKDLYKDAIQYFNYQLDNSNASCSGSAGGPANLTVGKDFSLGSDPMERRTNLVKALMVDYSLTTAQAAGIVGNFMWESGGEHLPPDINQGESTGAPPKFRGGYGWAQWTGSRQRTFIDFAVDNGYMSSAAVRATDAANYAYLKDELANGYRNTIPLVKEATTPEEAAIAFEADFERAGKPAIAERTRAARKVFGEMGGTPTNGGNNTTPGGNCTSGGATITGETAFPLVINKDGIHNRGMFRNGTASKSGHPYTAYDILVDPGTQVVAFMGGTVTHIGTDRCPGRLVSVYNAEANLTVSYLHLASSNHVGEGDTVALGGHIGVVGPGPAGCGTPHLHIDAARGNRRPGCSRLDCPSENASQFVDIGPQLYQGFQALPE